jgi:hypothetical protein
MQEEWYSDYVGLSGVHIPVRAKYLFSGKPSERLLSPLHFIHCVPGFCAGVKESVREINHTPPTSPEVKNEVPYTLSILYGFRAWTGRTFVLF